MFVYKILDFPLSHPIIISILVSVGVLNYYLEDFSALWLPLSTAVGEVTAHAYLIADRHWLASIKKQQ